MFEPLSPRDLDSWADADPITTADKETISMAVELREARKQIATAYQERARMVGAFMALFPGGIKPSEDGDENYYLVYLDTPEDQVSWHINKADRQWVPSLDLYHGEWDGHTADEKYDRLLLGATGVRMQVATLKAALENVEWIGDPTGEYNWTACPSYCSFTRRHESDCELAKALAQC